jgi:hypothetical protein
MDLYCINIYEANRSLETVLLFYGSVNKETLKSIVPRHPSSFGKK